MRIVVPPYRQPQGLQKVGPSRPHTRAPLKPSKRKPFFAWLFKSTSRILLQFKEILMRPKNGKFVPSMSSTNFDGKAIHPSSEWSMLLLDIYALSTFSSPTSSSPPASAFSAIARLGYQSAMTVNHRCVTHLKAARTWLRTV